MKLKQEMAQTLLVNRDGDTAALFTEIARDIDKWFWFVKTSQQAGN